MFEVCAVSSSCEKRTALSIKKGWQKLKAIRKSLGGTTANIDHFRFLSVIPKREWVPMFLTMSSGLAGVRKMFRRDHDLPLAHDDPSK